MTLFHTKSRKRRTGNSLRREGINCNLNLTMRFLGKVEEVDSIIKKLPVTESNKAGLESAKELLQQGMVLIIRRQKHIKMTDHSDNGWAVVQEYEANELAAK